MLSAGKRWNDVVRVGHVLIMSRCSVAGDLVVVVDSRARLASTHIVSLLHIIVDGDHSRSILLTPIKLIPPPKPTRPLQSPRRVNPQLP
jgi:hypothetical protein